MCVKTSRSSRYQRHRHVRCIVFIHSNAADGRSCVHVSLTKEGPLTALATNGWTADVTVRRHWFLWHRNQEGSARYRQSLYHQPKPNFTSTIKISGQKTTTASAKQITSPNRKAERGEGEEVNKQMHNLCHNYKGGKRWAVAGHHIRDSANKCRERHWITLAKPLYSVTFANL